MSFAGLQLTTCTNSLGNLVLALPGDLKQKTQVPFVTGQIYTQGLEVAKEKKALSLFQNCKQLNHL